VLISTDLASRGIDFRGVTRVVQFDFATNIVDLIHRVGRTARSGLPGAVTSFVTQHNASMLRAVYKHLLQQVSEESAEPSALEKVFSRNRGLRRRDRRAAARATEDQHEEPTKPTTAPQIPL
jgi:superfamily II DNA/RNA helicase